MDKFLSKIQKDAIMKIFIKDIIEVRVKQIREELASKYDVKSCGAFFRYRGLCDIASEMFVNSMNEYFDKNRELADDIQASVGSIHGEQQHNPQLWSKYWGYQHTWCYVKFAKMILYVDITSSQFADIYPDIPDYIISKKKIHYYLADKDNLAWKFRSRKEESKLNELCDLYEKFQYKVWGKISDELHSNALYIYKK